MGIRPSKQPKSGRLEAAKKSQEEPGVIRLSKKARDAVVLVSDQALNENLARIEGVDVARVTLGMRKRAKQAMQVNAIIDMVNRRSGVEG